MIIVAHRGIHHDHPENSLEAFLAAWNGGVAWCECDVRGSVDHVPFLLHDGTLDRTTDGVGLIEQVSSDVVAKIRLRWENKMISDCLVPTLEDGIKAMPKGAKFLIEIKPKVSDEVIRRTMKLCDPGTCVVQSFDVPVLHKAAEFRREIELMLLVDKATDPAAAEDGPWTQVNARFNSLNALTVQVFRDRGMRVGAWTPNEEADIKHALDLNLDMIISDQPLRVMRLADERKIG
jgi:glycerophosphoryl diester phosphodiesterase